MPTILALRRRLRRNQLACLFLAQGVPLLLAGDEVGNSQDGNNNAYCQDNETGWVDWSSAGSDDDLTAFVGDADRLRRRFPQLKPHHWVDGKQADGSYDVKWLTPAGDEMAEPDWNFPDGRFLVLCARRGDRRRRAAVHRAQRRRRSGRIHLPGMAGSRALDCA